MQNHLIHDSAVDLPHLLSAIRLSASGALVGMAVAGILATLPELFGHQIGGLEPAVRIAAGVVGFIAVMASIIIDRTHRRS